MNIPCNPYPGLGQPITSIYVPGDAVPIAVARKAARIRLRRARGYFSRLIREHEPHYRLAWTSLAVQIAPVHLEYVP